MTLSALQRHILREAYLSRQKRSTRGLLKKFYDRQTKPPKPGDIQNIITKSLERLIDKGYLIGFGRRTPRKWFIDEIALTALGRRAAKASLGEQQALPWKKRRIRAHLSSSAHQ